LAPPFSKVEKIEILFRLNTICIKYTYNDQQDFKMPAVTRSQTKFAKEYRPNEENTTKLTIIRNNMIENGVVCFDISKTENEQHFRDTLTRMLSFTKSLKTSNRVKFLKELFQYINLNIHFFAFENISPSMFRLAKTILEKTFEFDEVFLMNEEFHNKDFIELRKIYVVTRAKLWEILKESILNL